jgi:hypothetical protein
VLGISQDVLGNEGGCQESKSNFVTFKLVSHDIDQSDHFIYIHPPPHHPPSPVASPNDDSMASKEWSVVHPSHRLA